MPPKPFPCPEYACNNSYQHANRLKSHLENEHNYNKQQSSQALQQIPKPREDCPTCGGSYVNMRDHRNRCKGVSSRKQKVASSISNEVDTLSEKLDNPLVSILSEILRNLEKNYFC